MGNIASTCATIGAIATAALLLVMMKRDHTSTRFWWMISFIYGGDLCLAVWALVTPTFLLVRILWVADVMLWLVAIWFVAKIIRLRAAYERMKIEWPCEPFQ